MGKAVRGVAGIALIVVGAVLEPYSAGASTFLINVGVGLALGAAAEYLKKKPAALRPSESTIEYSGTVEPRRLIYGQCRVSGMQTMPPILSGLTYLNLNQVLTLAGHECYAIDDVYFNNVAIGTRNAITGTANDGKVTTGDFANKAWVRGHLGGSGQVADYILTSELDTGTWTTDYYGGGITYLALKFVYDETVYKFGKPDVTCDVRGMICYDPRLDSSPGDDPSDPAYAAWTSNPALCLANYLTHSLGMGESADRIDWDMVATAADICDETVDIPPVSPPGTQARYTCNTVLYATTDYRDNILELCSTMLGSCVYGGGKWRIRAGAWEAPSFEITESTVMGSVDLVTAYPYKDRWNSVRGTFLDPENNFQQNEFPAVSNATYVSDDGETVYKDVRLLGCNNLYEAERYGILVSRRSRNRQAATIPCDLSMFKVRPGDTGIVTISELGWTNKTVRCEGWKFDPSGIVILSVREEAESDWDDPIRADYETPDAVSTPAQTFFTPEAPSGLTATPTPFATNLSWTAPALVPVGAEYEVYEYTASTPFANASLVWHGRATKCSVLRSTTATRYYWVLLRTAMGVAGPEHPTSAAGVAGDIAAPERPNVAQDAGPLAFNSGTGAVKEITITVTGGEYVEVTVACRVEITDVTNLGTLHVYAGYGASAATTNCGEDLEKLTTASEAITIVGLAGPLTAGTYKFGLAKKLTKLNGGLPTTPEVTFTNITVRANVKALQGT